MPFIIPPALITAGKAIAGTLKAAKAAKTAALVGNALNVGSQLLTNRQQKRTNLEMYDRQRADALADWNRQNMYNAPDAQMKRFKDAGLNPHLIYGQMTTAQPIKTPDAKAPNYVAPQVDPEGLNVLGKQYALETQRLQLENMQKQGELIKAQTIKTNSETDWKNVNTSFAKDSYQNRQDILRIKVDRDLEEAFNANLKGDILFAQKKKVYEEINNIIANTQLSEARKAEVSAQVKNLAVTYDILGFKKLSAEQEAAFMKKIQALGIAGQTGAALLRALSKKP
jgi:hypothetical protein